MANYPSRRPPPPNWMRPLTDRLTPTVQSIVIGLTLIYFFYVLVPPLTPWLAGHVLLGPGFWSGQLWQPATALAVNTHFSGWLFTLIGLWWVGSFIERVRGRQFFLTLLIVSGVLANLVAAVVARAVGDVMPRSDGAGFALTGVFVSFARIYGARPAQIWGALSMRADRFTWILLGFSLLVALLNQDWAGFAAELTAIGAGVAITATGGDIWSRLGLSRPGAKARKYQVLDGGKGRPTDLN